MAGLRKMRDKYYARIFIPREGRSRHEKLIPLDTDKKREAEKRMSIIRKEEQSIRIGMDISFPWRNGEGRAGIIERTLADATQEYLETRSNDKLAPKTIISYKLALSHFCRANRKNLKVRYLENKHIESFKQWMLNSGYSGFTINLHLTSVKSFLIWLKEERKINSIPKVKKLKVRKNPPIYLSNTEFAEIMKLTWLDGHYKRAFHFYRETGCRLSEPYYGAIKGNFLIIDADNVKTRTERSICLTPELLGILDDMKNRYGSGMHRKQYSKVFREACCLAGIKGKKFHSLRHTFAVRCYLQTRDIYYVAKMMGHSTVATTEKYAQFDIRLLKQDFPDLAGDYHMLPNINKKQESGYVLVDTIQGN